MTFTSIIILIVLILVFVGGFTVCFWGYRRFINGVKSSGFFIGGLLGFLIIFPFSMANKDTTQTLLFLGAGFLVGGVIGFIFSVSINKVLTFIVGAILGFSLSVLFFSPNAFKIMFGATFTLAGLKDALGPSIIIHFILALILGVLSLLFQRPLIIASTAIWGGAWIVLPLAFGYYWMQHNEKTISLKILYESVQTYRIFLLMGWIIFSVFGLLFQFRYGTKGNQSITRRLKKPK